MPNICQTCVEVWVSHPQKARREPNHLVPVISSRAGGRKFQKEKETIGRSDALLIFAPDTHVLQWSAIALNARIPPIKLESLLLITFL